MKKIITLTENDLTRIVKKVLLTEVSDKQTFFTDGKRKQYYFFGSITSYVKDYVGVLHGKYVSSDGKTTQNYAGNIAGIQTYARDKAKSRIPDFDEKLERCFPYRDRGNYKTVDQNCRSRVLSELNGFHDEYVKSCFTSISTNSLVQNMPARIKVSNDKDPENNGSYGITVFVDSDCNYKGFNYFWVDSQTGNLNDSYPLTVYQYTYDYSKQQRDDAARVKKATENYYKPLKQKCIDGGNEWDDKLKKCKGVTNLSDFEIVATKGSNTTTKDGKSSTGVQVGVTDPNSKSKSQGITFQLSGGGL
jgi:hypothetical protein